MATYTEAPQSVIHLAEQIINQHHHNLLEAKIAFVMRDEAPKSNGRSVAAQAQKVTALNQALIDYDFLIWIAEDRWDKLSEDQKEALIDHELCHCWGWPGMWKMRHHDIEEFQEIIERHGMWREELVHMANAVKQLRMPFDNTEVTLEHNGKVVTISGELLGKIAQ